MIYRLVLEFIEESYIWDFESWDQRQKVIKDLDGMFEWEAYELREDNEQSYCSA